MVNFEGTGPFGISRRNWMLGGGIGAIVVVSIIIIIIVASSSGSGGRRAGSSILEEVPLVDGYNNLPQLLRKCAENNLEKIQFRSNLSDNKEWDDKCKTFTDLPRMEKGKLRTQVWYASAPCDIQYKDATAYVLEQIDALKRLVRKHSDEMQLVTSISELKEAHNNKRVASFVGVDSAHVIDSRLGVLRTLYDLGVRFLTLSSCDTPWLISDRTKLTPFGKYIVSEVNRLGIVLDLVGLPIPIATEIMQISAAPIIVSHTAAKTVYKNNSNVDDSFIREVKIKNGLLMLTFDSLMITKNATPTLDHLFAHFDHFAKESSIENIGIGSGFGLFGTSIPGIDDTSYFPNLFDKLRDFQSKYKIDWRSMENLKKIAYKNFERVFLDVEKVRDAKLKDSPISDWIANSDFTPLVKEHEEIKVCRSSYKADKKT